MVITMTIALLAPLGVRMPPPLLIDCILHCRANIKGKTQTTKFFYIAKYAKYHCHPHRTPSLP